MSSSTRRIVLGVVAVLVIGGFVAWWFSGFSLEFMRFFAAEKEVELEITSRPTIEPSPTSVVGGVVVCAPATQTVQVDDPATITATGGAGAYEWFAPGGAIVGTGGQITVTYATVGTKKVTVQAVRADSTEIDSVACTVIVTAQ